MNLNKKLVIATIIAFIISFSITYYVVRKIDQNNVIDKVSNIFTNDTIQERIENSNSINDLSVNIDGNSVIGIIEIDKISFKGLVYEGTDLSTLKIGVGHFSFSPLVDGNVCFAAHNTRSFWRNLKKLQKDDIITYTSIYGKMNYSVFNITEIDETDFSLLENTQENIITLITCVKNTPKKRLCVQAERI